MWTERTPRVAAARKLHRRTARRATGRFLIEGAQAVGEAVAQARTRPPGWLQQVLCTSAAAGTHRDLLDAAAAAGADIGVITEKAAGVLAETVTPQGVFAVAGVLDVPAPAALTGRPRLVMVLVEVADPGNAGTAVRVADAAGAGAVIFAGDTVDPHNGKCVRASTGSLFHVPIGCSADAGEALAVCRAAGLQTIAADPRAGLELDAPAAGELLTRPSAWVFGHEARGLPGGLADRCDHRVRVPIYGRAESLNLATAAAVCLYASARAQRQ